MRQAGRYLPEYLELRRKHSFLEVCKTPELACEVTLQPIERFQFDAAILFCDILVPLEPMGAAFSFAKGGPKLEKPLRHEDDINALRNADAEEELSFVGDAVRLIKTELPRTPLIGFAGAPFTLAAYLVEGGCSKNFENLKALLYGRPELFASLLDKLADQVADFIAMQVNAGVQAVQLFDTWAGILTPADYERFVLPGVRKIFDRLGSVPRVLFVKNGAPFVSSMARSGADAISLDWTVDLEATARRFRALSVQGNLDPTVLFGSHDEIRRRVLEVCRAGDCARGHVFNLGHGILPSTPIDAVELLVDTVRSHGAGGRA